MSQINDNPAGTAVGTSDTQTLTNKSFQANNCQVIDQTDATKKVRFSAASVSPNTTRTITVPDTDDTLTTIAAAQTLTNKTIGGFYRDIFALTDNATIPINWFNGSFQTVTIAGNRTLTFANPTEGGTYVLLIKQDAIGSRTITWPAGILWRVGQPPTLTTAANKTDIIQLYYIGATYYADFFLNF